MKYTMLAATALVLAIQSPAQSEFHVDPPPGSPKFLALPFNETGVTLRQGWYYDNEPPLPDPILTCPFGTTTLEGIPHCGIDFVRGAPGNRTTFTVVAAAPGKARRFLSASAGTYVVVEHTEVDPSQRTFYTRYLHLDADPLLQPIPTDTWQQVEQGAWLGMAGMTGDGVDVIHLHFDVMIGGYEPNLTLTSRVDPFDIAGDLLRSTTQPTFEHYPFNALFQDCGAHHLFIECPLGKEIFFNGLESGDVYGWSEIPIGNGNLVVRYLSQGHPGAPGKDIWTTSVFSYAPPGGGPGGGLDNLALVVGGWADVYHALLEFDLTGLPPQAESASLELHCYKTRSGSTTQIYLDRVTAPWDWRTQGTGPDRQRLWWADRPSTAQWHPGLLPAPEVGSWYRIDITDLYNSWMDGSIPNYGVKLRPGPSPGNNTWSEFYSANYDGDPSLRPRIIVRTPE